MLLWAQQSLKKVKTKENKIAEEPISIHFILEG